MRAREDGSSMLDDVTDLSAMVQRALREAYLESVDDLRLYAAKVKELNEKKRAIRRHLISLREVRSQVFAAAHDAGLKIYAATAESRERFAGLIRERARQAETEAIEQEEPRAAQIELELGIPQTVPPAEVTTAEEFDDYIKKWEEELATVGDDAQLANIDLQNALHRQQQTLQLMSNVSKMVHDTAMAVIRKIG